MILLASQAAGAELGYSLQIGKIPSPRFKLIAFPARSARCLVLAHLFFIFRREGK